jgi:hypothetical protein
VADRLARYHDYFMPALTFATASQPSVYQPPNTSDVPSNSPSLTLRLSLHEKPTAAWSISEHEQARKPMSPYPDRYALFACNHQPASYPTSLRSMSRRIGFEVSYPQRIFILSPGSCWQFCYCGLTANCPLLC